MFRAKILVGAKLATPWENYLNLSLQGLDVVDDLVEHDCLPGNLNSVSRNRVSLHSLRNGPIRNTQLFR
jgi:hypothetical protein